jgi:hypothetical protein
MALVRILVRELPDEEPRSQESLPVISLPGRKKLILTGVGSLPGKARAG